MRFARDSHSRSRRGVLRGLHYQLPPHAQGKLARVVRGEIYDAAVDIRRGSATFGLWVDAHLSEQNQHRLWIPPGFAHGFLVLSETADFLYKTTAYYAPQAERSAAWDDPEIGAAWPLAGLAPQVSAKDALGLRLSQAPVFD